MREQNSAATINRREMLKLSTVATLIGTAAFPDKIQATQTVAMKSLPELPPKPSADVAAKLFLGFVQTEVRTSGVITFGGGIPIKDADGTVIGAIGVSGSTVDNDVKVANAAVEACNGRKLATA